MGASRSSSSSSPVDMTPGQFERLRRPLVDQLLGFMENGFPQYEGPMTADMTGQEEDLLGQIGNFGNSDPYNSLLGTARRPVAPLARPGETAQTVDRLGFGENSANPFLNRAIRAATRPITQQLTETLDRALPGRFTQAGHFVQPQGSSAFDRAAAIATRGAAQEMGDISSDMSFQSFDAERDRRAALIEQERGREFETRENALNRKVEAATRAPAVQAQEVNTVIDRLSASALPRMIEEMGIERGIAAFNDRITNMLASLGLTSATSRPVIANSSESGSGGISLK